MAPRGRGVRAAAAAAVLGVGRGGSLSALCLLFGVLFFVLVSVTLARIIAPSPASAFTGDWGVSV